MIFLENPYLVGILGGGLVLLFVKGWLSSGRRELLFAALGCLALTVGLLFLERSIETDREQVRNTLHQLAHDIESDDADAVLTNIHSKANSAMVAQLKLEMARWKLNRVQINRNLEIESQPEHQPPQMKATFNCTVEVGNIGGQVGLDRPIPIKVKALFQRDGERWKVRDGEWAPFDGRFD